MERTPVRSSNISSIGYCEDSNTLEVEFHGGALYAYYEVPADLHTGLKLADSHGSYLHRHIKGKYRYARLS